MNHNKEQLKLAKKRIDTWSGSANVKYVGGFDISYTKNK